MGVDPVPGLDRICLLGFDRDGTVHLLHLLFSFPVELYSLARRLFACKGDLPDKHLPLMMELPAESFVMLRSVRAVTREKKFSHRGGISLSNC